MRVVLDTNVLVSGIFFGGVPNQILNSWLEDKFEVFATPKILVEYTQTLERLGGKYNFGPQWVSRAKLFSELCRIIPDLKLKGAFSRDPTDDKFIACARGCHANYVITGDNDLKVLDGKFEFRIVAPSQFFTLIK